MSAIRQTRNYMWNTRDALGHGATGNVYKARHKLDGEMYAVKIFNADSFCRPESVQMREFEIMSQLDHKNIAKMLAVEEQLALREKVIIMELCSGGSLYSMLIDEPQNAYGLAEEEFLCVLGDVTNGVEYLRSRKIAHRDIKPANILRYITEDGRSVYKLTDFGAARELQDGEQFQSLYGTEEYLHPDIYERAVLKKCKGQTFNATVDLWSLGVTFYHVATGHLPFRPFGGRENKETMYQMIGEKESGVISGVQIKKGGSIKWNRRLPDTCVQSQGLQDLITPMFASLLETDPEKQWSFDQLFDYVSLILSKQVIHVFGVPQASTMRIYIDKHPSYTIFQELVALQTDIPAEQQLLLFDNDSLATIVTQSKSAERFPSTSVDSPVFLIPRTSHEFLPISQHIVPSLPKFHTSVNYEHDLQIARMMCEILHLTEKEMLSNLRKERHLKAAVQMLIHYYSTNICKMRGTLKDLQSRERVQSQQLSTLQTCHGRETDLLHLVNKQFTDLPEEVVTSEFQLDEMVENCTSTAGEVNRLLKDTANKVMQCYDQYVGNRGLATHWYTGQGVSEGDNSLMVMRELVKAVENTVDEFKKDAVRRLNQCEIQVHQFERQKIEHRCRKGMKLFFDIFKKLKDVYNQLPDWFAGICEFREKYKVADCLIERLGDTVDGFATKLDMTAEQYSETMSHILRRLRLEAIDHPIYRESIEGAVSEVSNSLSSANMSAPNSWTFSGDMDDIRLPPTADKECSQKAQELCDSLKSLNESSAEVRKAIDENKKLIEGLKMLKKKTYSQNTWSVEEGSN